MLRQIGATYIADEERVSGDDAVLLSFFIDEQIGCTFLSVTLVYG
jgi:hypothetical protein